jgi:hypothetical protein
MSIHNSYFSKNNTIIYNSYTNTGRNPVTELFFGRVDNVISPKGFSRFIFDIDLSQLQEKISQGIINTGRTMTHTLNMTNTIMFNYDLLNTTTSDGRRRAISFDLELHRIPKINLTGASQTWDEGVGYDYYDNASLNSSNASLTSVNEKNNDRSFSSRPSNWYNSQTISGWSTNGIYVNNNTGTGNTINYSGLTFVDTQHFEFGNENIEFDMTNEINSILTGGTTGLTGWIISFKPDVENISGLTENYSVGFFTRHTQTFYEPYLQTNYNDLIIDDRNAFYSGKQNKLYLYSYINGRQQNFDSTPIVYITDPEDEILPSYSALTTNRITEGVYECVVPSITGYTTPSQFLDTWTNISIDGNSISNIENEFVLLNQSEYYQISTQSKEPVLFGFDFSGIKQDEKILNTDTRKINVFVKQAYSSKIILPKVECYYRVYVKEGTTEVNVQDWTQINKTTNEYYFIFDTKDKIPNEYYIDIKAYSSGQVDTYKRQLKFQIVNQK